MTTKSPLGDASSIYQTKKQETGSIFDRPSLGLLELYPAGYTKPSERDGHNRQETHNTLWSLAVHGKVEDNFYPFEKNNHSVILIPDVGNKFDPHAINLILQVTDINSPLYCLDGKDLGFIPMRISKYISRNKNMIHKGMILKVKSNFHKKFCGTKIMFTYGDPIQHMKDHTLSRFSMIMEN